MGTELWVDHKQAIWNVLPLHPQPQPLESITSYITRLAEANGRQSINELVGQLAIELQTEGKSERMRRNSERGESQRWEDQRTSLCEL